MLVAGIYPWFLVNDKRRGKKAYSRWTAACIVAFGLIVSSASGKLAITYGQSVTQNSIANGELHRLKSQHSTIVQHLDLIWQAFPNEVKVNPQSSLALLEHAATPEIRKEFAGQLPIYVDAKVMQFEHQNSVDWLVLCILGGIVGVLNIIAGIMLL